MKPPYAVLLLLPMPLLLLLGYASANGIKPVAALPYLAAAVALVGWGGAFFSWYSHRKLTAQRLHIDIKPGLIETMGGETFYQGFSTSTHFLYDLKAFTKAVHDAASRPSHSKGRFAYPREAVHVRIWPGALGLTEVEYEMMVEILAEHFIDPTFEVVDSVTNTKSAIRA